MGMLFQRETFVEFDLEFGGVGFVVFVAGLVGVEEFHFATVGPGDV